MNDSQRAFVWFCAVILALVFVPRLMGCQFN